MQKEYFSLFGNGRRNNKKFSLSAGDTVICHFNTFGIDTATDKYYDLKSDAKVVSIVNSKIATLTHINNQELDSPITLGTATSNKWTRTIEWGTIKVRADQDATSFEVYAA